MKKRTSPAYLKLARQLRDAVLQGELKPGVRLKIDELAHKYDTSATPVRQALQALQDEGIVVAQMNKGATVRVIDSLMAGHLYDLRRSILGLLIADCVGRASERDIDELEKLVAGQQSDDVNSAQDAQMRFFARIAEIGGNRFAAEVLERHWPMLVAVREYYGFKSVVGTDQKALVQAIAKRDTDAAVSIARAGCERAKQELELCMRQSAKPDGGTARDKPVRREGVAAQV